jgi:hypothetical protein
MEFWGYKNEVRLRGLTKNQGFCNLLQAGFECNSCGFNRQVQDMSNKKIFNFIPENNCPPVVPGDFFVYSSSFPSEWEGDGYPDDGGGSGLFPFK